MSHFIRHITFILYKCFAIATIPSSYILCPFLRLFVLFAPLANKNMIKGRECDDNACNELFLSFNRKKPRKWYTIGRGSD